ncbi:hypothetical protein Gpo141_00009870 [Globisporangium polare]
MIPAATSVSAGHGKIRSALGVIRAYNDCTATIEQQRWDTEAAVAAAAAATYFVDGVDLDQDLLVDSELVRNLVESGSADAIVAEQAAKALIRRRKHRENMIRYRRKKKMSFEDMRKEEQRLAAQLHTMLHEHIAKQQEQQLGPGTGLQQQQQQQVPASSRAMGEFVGILAQKERLHHENAMLRHKLADFQKLHTAVQEANEQDGEEMRRERQRQADGAGADINGEGYWMRFLANDTPFYYEPFSFDECRELERNTLEDVFAHQCSYMADPRPNGAQQLKLFDWTASLAFDWDETIKMTMIKYQFKKRFRNPQRTVEQLVHDEWTILHNASLYQSIHRVPVFSQVLQKVDDSMSIVMWNAPEPEQSLRFRNVSLFTRGRYTSPEGREGGIVTITGVQLKNFKEQELLSIDEFWKKHNNCASSTSSGEMDDSGGGGDAAAAAEEKEEVEDDGRVVYTHGGFVYTTFADCEDGDIEVEFGGRVEIVSEDQGRFLMVELGGTCVRLEHLLFPFRMLSSG